MTEAPKGRWKPFLLGLTASFFFSLTFILNRSMELGGGFWIWSGVLRFVFMVPLLALLVPWNGGFRPIWVEVRRAPWSWWAWSTVGFGLFYAPVCWAASFGQGWLVAGLWQITIVAGVLLFARGRIPWATLVVSGLILVGVALLQVGHVGSASGASTVAVGILILVGAAAYPLGNRHIMTIAGGRLTTVQRVMAMTLLSLPFWAVLAGFALAWGKVPGPGQVAQSALVAVFSGVLATVLFFRATDMVRHNPSRLGAVEATQAGEVLFSLGGEMLLLGGGWPELWSALGLGLVIAGMIAHGLMSRHQIGVP